MAVIKVCDCCDNKISINSNHNQISLGVNNESKPHIYWLDICLVCQEKLIKVINKFKDEIYQNKE